MRLSLKKVLVVFVALSGAAIFLGASQSAQSVKRGEANAGLPYSILVVAGQSNANGAQSLTVDPANGIDVFGAQSVQPADSQTQFAFENFFNNSSFGNGKATIVPLNTPQTADSNTPAQFGPEVGLARRLYELGRRRVIIVKVAAGGTALNQNANLQDWNVNSNNELYQALKDRFADVTGYLDDQGATYSLDGFYWMQGEADVDLPHAQLYEQNLKDLIAAVKTDFPVKSDTQFVLGKTSMEKAYDLLEDWFGEPGCSPYTCDQKREHDDMVRAAQQAVADSMSDVSIVETEPLERIDFNIHLSNKAQLELGKMFADATELSTTNKLPTQGTSLVKSVEESNRVFNPNIAGEPYFRDGAASIKLGDKVMWMFGDPLYTNESGIRNADNNQRYRSSSAALAPINDPFNMQEPRDANGAAKEFLPFNPTEKAYNAASTDPWDRYIKWPVGAINTSAAEGYVFYQHIKAVPPSSTQGLGIGIAKITENTTETTEINENLFGPDQQYMPNAVRDGVAYFRKCDGINLEFDKICSVAKVNVNEAGDRSKYLFWNGTEWQSDINSAAMSSIGSSNAVQWSEYLGKYINVYMRGFSNSIVIRTADKPEGPWSNAEFIYQNKGSKYTAIPYLHPELASADGKTLVMSLVKQEPADFKPSGIYTLKINLNDLENITTNPDGNNIGVGTKVKAPKTGLGTGALVGFALTTTAFAALVFLAYKQRARKEASAK